MQSTTGASLNQYIDHTLLKADATEADIIRLCTEARQFSFKAVCVNPIFVKTAARELNGSSVLIASVIGFPLGASLPETKAFETQHAVAQGASEIDMVIRLDLAKVARWNEVRSDISAVATAAKGARVKVILETGLLSTDEIRRACEVSAEAGASFVKTATGFLGRGATLDDISLMRSSCSLEIKASGGVKTADQAWAMIHAGATRIGTSSGVALVSGTTAGSGY